MPTTWFHPSTIPFEKLKSKDLEECVYCSGDSIGDELVQEIESVVFSYLEPADTLNASDFAELRSIRTEGIRSEGERLRGELARLIREECALRDNIAKMSAKQARIKALQDERAGLTKQLPSAASKEEEKLQQDLKAARDALARVNASLGADKAKLQKIGDIRVRVGSARQSSQQQGNGRGHDARREREGDDAELVERHAAHVARRVEAGRQPPGQKQGARKRADAVDAGQQADAFGAERQLVAANHRDHAGERPAKNVEDDRDGEDGGEPAVGQYGGEAFPDARPHGPATPRRPPPAALPARPPPP